MWRLDDGAPVGEPLPGSHQWSTAGMCAVATGQLDGTPVIVSGYDDGTVRVWRLADGAPVGKRLRACGSNGVRAFSGVSPIAVAAGRLGDGKAVIVSACDSPGGDHTIRVWRLARRTRVGPRCAATPARSQPWH